MALFNASVVTITGSLIDLNEAEGCGGGNAEGGGMADLLSANTTLSSSIVALNEADGGSGCGLGSSTITTPTRLCHWRNLW